MEDGFRIVMWHKSKAQAEGIFLSYMVKTCDVIREKIHRAIKNKHKNKVTVVEMKMLCRICDKIRHDKIRNVNAKKCFGNTYSEKDCGK